MKNFGELSLFESDKDIVIKIDEFIEFYKNRPLSENHGGCLSINMFYTWFIFNKIKPKYVIESGIFQGQGTWLIENIESKPKVFAIDPLPQQRLYISPNVKYTTQDFLTFTNDNISKDRAKETMIYFDDHQDQYKRLNHAYSLGFKHIMLDDNYPKYCGRRHISIDACLNNSSDKGYILPKNAKEDLKNIISTYYICTPLFRYHPSISMEESYLTDWIMVEMPYDKPQWKILQDDMHNYRWTTYIKLKE